jgi:exodeoxyribonuclease-3
MKLISWNVNGIRAALKKGFLDFVKQENPDVLCLQETKAERSQVMLELPGYHQFWNSADKKGYSGTAVFTKKIPKLVETKMSMREHDLEGRVITLDYGDFYLVNVYTPNSKRGLERLDYRVEWDADFLRYLQQLEKVKPVVFCGDLNVAHQEIDLARPKNNRKNAGFTDEERKGFDNLVNAGFIDTFRHFHSEGDNYTWWSYMFNSRAKNVGWRIDYFGVSPSLKGKLKSASILADVMGSDHCPVTLVLK